MSKTLSCYSKPKKLEYLCVTMDNVAQAMSDFLEHGDHGILYTDYKKRGVDRLLWTRYYHETYYIPKQTYVVEDCYYPLTLKEFNERYDFDGYFIDRGQKNVRNNKYSNEAIKELKL